MGRYRTHNCLYSYGGLTRLFMALLLDSAKNTPITLYLVVAVLATVQYMGENAIVFPHAFGAIIEELTEATIYSIALVYLWNFKLIDFEACLSNKLNFETVTQ